MKRVFPPEIIETSIENHFSHFSKKSRLLYFIVLLMLCVAVGLLFFIRAEITVQSRGILRSSAESVSLVSPVIGKVTKANLDENQWVSRGDTIVWLDVKKIEERIIHIESLIKENEIYLRDIALLLKNIYFDFESNLFRSAYASYRQKLSELDLNIELQEKLYSRSKTLFDKEVIPIVQMEKTKFTLDNLKEERKYFVQSSRNEWENLAVNYQLKNKKHRNELENLRIEKKNFVITVPVTGYITQYSGIKSGSFVTTGESIARISPQSQILAEQMVSPKDIGYLKKGMPVIFQVDAYNYNQWGMATGKIIEISNEVYLVNNQPCFKVRSSLDQSFLALKNGYKGELKKGLTVTARFKVTKRTLAQLLFDKTDNWLNPKIISE